MNTIKFKQLHESFKIPKKATNLAAGFDVVVTEMERIGNNKVFCKLGFAAQLPVGYKLELVPRSNLTKHNWVMNNSPGQGDADFEHEYQMRFTAIPTGVRIGSPTYIRLDDDDEVCIDDDIELELTYDSFPYEVGDRIGQVFLTKVEECNWEQINEFEDRDSDRKGGWGSTGLK